MSNHKTKFWLFKSDAESYSIFDLEVKKNQEDSWEGVRNYQARNFMMEMKKGDLGFFYHSNCKEPGIVGLLEVTKEAYEDSFAFDKNSKYYDPKSTLENPRWYMVSLKHLKTFQKMIPLKTLKTFIDNELLGMKVLQKGNRLSVTPVNQEHFEFIRKMAEKN